MVKGVKETINSKKDDLKKEPSRVKLLILLFIAVMAISLASILAVLASAPGSVTAFWRLFLSLFILLILRPKIIQKPQKLRFLGFPIVAGVSLGIHFASWIESLFHASVAVSTTVVCTHALFSGFFSSFFGEKPNKIQLFGAAIAIGGVYFLSGADPSSTPYGVVLALIGAVAGGVYFATGRFVGDRIAFNSYVFLTYSVATLTTLLINIINLSINSPANPVNPPINLSLSYDLFHYLFHYLFDYPMQTWIYFVLLAIIPMSIGHTILNYVLRHMKALPVTTTVLGEAVGASILAYLILGQLLPANAYLAMIVVLTGIAIVLKRD